MLPTRSVTFVLLLAACSSGTHAGPASTTRAPDPAAVTDGVTAATRLDCTDPIAALPRPDPGYEVIGRAIALQTARSSRTYLDTTPTGGPSTSSPRFAKTGLLVRTGTAATVTVPPEWRDRVAVEWGNTTRRTATIRLHVPACPGAGRWIAFPGGYLVRTPACIGIDVRVGRRTHRIRVGVGTGCRGQRPPPVVPPERPDPPTPRRRARSSTR